MTKGFTIWYRCLFCTRVYPKSHQLVEHRKANHAEQWNQRKLAKQLEAMKSNGLNEEASEEDNESVKNSEEMETEDTSPDEGIENDLTSDDNDTASNSTVRVNDSEVETEYDESQSESEDTSQNKSNEDEDCKIVYKNCIKKSVLVKLTKCDEDLIRIKKEVDLLETDDTNTFENLSDVIVPMSACLKEPVVTPAPVKTERVFKLYKCDHCNKQFLHKWGLKLHQDVHKKKSNKKCSF